MTPPLEEFQIYLPKYLSAEAQKVLFSSLEQFPENIDSRIYTNYLENEENFLQGDGIKEILAIDLPSMRTKTIRAIIISNSCDICPDNERYIPHNVLYAPIIELDSYSRMLENKKLSMQRISSHLTDIRKQRISNIFYLPNKSSILPESIVFLDRINNYDINFFRNRWKELRLFTLSDYGFYLFIYKLSIHFTRMREGIERRTGMGRP